MDSLRAALKSARSKEERIKDVRDLAFLRVTSKTSKQPLEPLSVSRSPFSSFRKQAQQSKTLFQSQKAQQELNEASGENFFLVHLLS
ncbi:hypothetical protein L596_007411 [Steinernema carpocapsae]|uniref:Uncharacterized protein n=1 Tax=Steinernema carpocapsae TaxID=34508 RepID=A0A4U5P9W2_STECR|nr:hypothetical protein L596_007411 [Steinernema carpocapsae]